MATALTTRLFPEDMSIDNETSAEWTIVELPAHTVRGHLHDLLKALSLHQIDMSHIGIARHHGIRHVQLFLRQRYSGKITSPEAQRTFHLFMECMRQFLPFLPAAPDPAMALRHFERLMEHLLPQTSQLERMSWFLQPSTLHALAIVLGSSQFLWEDFLRRDYALHHTALTQAEATSQYPTRSELEVSLQRSWSACITVAEQKQALQTSMTQELFHIFVHHLLIGKYLSSRRKLDHVIAPKEGFETQL